MKRTVSRGAPLLLVLTLCAMPAGAAPKRHARSRRLASPAVPAAVGPECPAEDRAGAAGFRAFVDPETGQLREGTPEEQQALSNGARALSAEAAQIPEMVVYPDGLVVVDLKGNFMQSMTAVANPDGSLSFGCGPDSPKTAAPKPAHAPALEER